MTYVAAADRYKQIGYRRCGRSGIQLPEVSLGLWHNFGDDRPLENSRAILRRAFDLGITHFDLANNYGLNAEGIPTPRDAVREFYNRPTAGAEWRSQSVTKILMS